MSIFPYIRWTAAGNRAILRASADAGMNLYSDSNWEPTPQTRGISCAVNPKLLRKELRVDAYTNRWHSPSIAATSAADLIVDSGQ